MGVLEQFDGGREKGGQGKTRQTLGRVETREKPVMAHRGSELRNCDGVFKNPVAIHSPGEEPIVCFDKEILQDCDCKPPNIAICDGVFKNPVAIPAGRLVVEFDLKSHCICEIPSHSERQFGIVIL